LDWEIGGEVELVEEDGLEVEKGPFECTTECRLMMSRAELCGMSGMRQ